ncbi:Glutaredoxin 3 [Defluviimonas aquaemixtae]|uniref:Glutaredoxin n=1 Tax=Albidovulum aquaemixtae TaxID=1542388 RepID=A0A2R8BJV4_9RHOB|nr:glutaredoxin 3 [Defluviimonas aquaemixtae]SPH23570.1 Glutaredoxin 3 [Defluviimonas aquaemixtae]
MPRIEIFTTPWCPYCVAAKRLLERKGASYEETDVSGDIRLRQEMTQRAMGRRTVPQIFIDNRHIGGADELHTLDRMGKLDPLIAR